MSDTFPAQALFMLASCSARPLFFELPSWYTTLRELFQFVSIPPKNSNCFSYLVQALVRISKDFLCLKMSDESAGQHMPYCPEQMSTPGFAGSSVYNRPLCNYAMSTPGFVGSSVYNHPLCNYAMSRNLSIVVTVKGSRLCLMATTSGTGCT